MILEGFGGDARSRGAIHVRVAGSGPPLLLLHGYPQTGAMWHRVAPALAEERTVVVADLRGYGASSKPPTSDDHEPYSKRAMARDMVAEMAALGFHRFDLAGHDRGARVSYRLALDHPGSCGASCCWTSSRRRRCTRATTMRSALGMWHWFFLPQPYDLPERLLAADPEGFYFRTPRAREALFDRRRSPSTRRALRDPAVIHAICEDYRAGATYDRELDVADKGTGRIACPLLVLWGAQGPVGALEPLKVWAEWADDVRGGPMPCGHHIPEEAPEETITALREFLS